MWAVLGLFGGCEHSVQRLNLCGQLYVCLGGASTRFNGWTECGQLYVCLGVASAWSNDRVWAALGLCGGLRALGPKVGLAWAALGLFGGCEHSVQWLDRVRAALGLFGGWEHSVQRLDRVRAALGLFGGWEHSVQRLDRVWAALGLCGGLRALSPSIGPSVGLFKKGLRIRKRKQLEAQALAAATFAVLELLQAAASHHQGSPRIRNLAGSLTQVRGQ